MADVEFKDAPEVEVIAREIIRNYHSGLAQAKIRYIFRYGTWTVKGDERWGSASKCTGKERFLTGSTNLEGELITPGYDFVIMINGDIWKGLGPKERIALVDHELCHCYLGDNGWAIRDHVIQAFPEEIRRHGLWQENLRMVARSMEEHRQMTMFVGEGSMREAI